MAYLPPELAQSHPTSIGRPIPGGSFTLEPLDGWSEHDVGELVYHGPNVMMGYAHGPADLALGKTVDTLHTGDIARRTPDGLYEVIGRSSRFVKLYGLRIDLQRVEAVAARRRRDRDLHRRRRAARGRRGRPRRAATYNALRHGVAAFPRPPSESSPSTSCRCCRRASRTIRPCATSRRRADRARAVACRPARAVRRRAADRFANDPRRPELRRPRRQLAVVRGDVGAARTGARPPARPTGSGCRWPSWSDIASRTRSRPWLGATLETSVALRAAAIVLVVGSHAELYELWGGAHLLLGIAGYNFGRFCLTPVPRTRPGSPPAQHHRVDRAAVGAVGRVRAAHHRRLHRTNLLLANKFLGPARQHDGRPAVVRRGAGVDAGRADVGVLAARGRPAGAATPVRVRGRLPGHRAGVALRPVRPGLRPRRLVHDARVLVLRRRLGGGEVDRRCGSGSS